MHRTEIVCFNHTCSMQSQKQHLSRATLQLCGESLDALGDPTKKQVLPFSTGQGYSYNSNQSYRTIRQRLQASKSFLAYIAAAGESISYTFIVCQTTVLVLPTVLSFAQPPLLGHKSKRQRAPTTKETKSTSRDSW